MRSFLFISKILIKLHLNKILFHILCPFLKKDKSLPCIEDAYKYLNTVSENPNNSCICCNQLKANPLYDLQIIIPAYNVEKYIGDCLESVFNQKTQYNYLVIVINDGSKDGTLSVINKYKNKDNLVIIDQANQGLSGARNAGLIQINAKYILFIDSDDILLPNALETLLEKTIQNNVDIAAGGYQRIKNNQPNSCVVLKESLNADYKQLPGFAWGKIYNSELFQHIHFPSKYLYEDTLMTLIIYPICKHIVTISDLVYGYRINQQGITLSNKSKPKNLDSFWITEQLLIDRNNIGITENDSVFCKTILSQIKVNFQRIVGMNNNSVDKAVFVLSRKLLYDNIHTFETLNIKSPLRDAFIQNNYKKYRLACLLNI